jgi:hypothetical protein
MNAEGQKEKRLHEGDVGPEMRSPAGLNLEHTTGAASIVNGAMLTQAELV